METESIKYLINAANLIENDILKSQYFIRSTLLAHKNGLNLPAKFKNNLSRCPKCLIPHNENTKYTIQPLKIFHKKNGEKFKPQNIFILECDFCKYKVKKKLEKPIKVTPIIEDIKITKIKKKKKSKDKFCGLKRDAIIAVNSKLWEPKPQPTLPKTKDDFIQEKMKKKEQKFIETRRKEKQIVQIKKKFNKLNNIMSVNVKAKKHTGLKEFLHAFSKQ